MTTTQLIAIEEGKKHRERLSRIIDRAIKSSLSSNYPHTYIYSPPGLGKTYSVNKSLSTNNCLYFEVSGSVSMFAFGISLATIKWSFPNQKVIISVDDCDVLFKNEESINIMKNILSGNRVYSYQKNINAQLGNLSELQRAAVENFSTEHQMGFRVPCDNFIFIFTSNFKLPTDDEVSGSRSKGHSSRKIHLNAIRSRCNTMDFELNKIGHYGWLADVLINELNIQQKHKDEILEWLWKNWDNLNERSLRTIEKMAQSIINDPEEYKILWELDFLNDKEEWN